MTIIIIESIITDDIFDVTVRNEARTLSENLKGKNFLILFNFVSNVLQYLSYCPNQMRETTATLTDFVEFVPKINKQS